MTPSKQIKDRSAHYARVIARIVTGMPVERAAQVYDFVRFLQTDTGPAAPDYSGEDDWLDDTEEQIQAEEAVWDAAYAHHADAFRALADVARAEIVAGVTQPMFSENGQIMTDELAHDA